MELVFISNNLPFTNSKVGNTSGCPKSYKSISGLSKYQLHFNFSSSEMPKPKSLLVGFCTLILKLSSHSISVCK